VRRENWVIGAAARREAALGPDREIAAVITKHPAATAHKDLIDPIQALIAAVAQQAPAKALIHVVTSGHHEGAGYGGFIVSVTVDPGPAA